MNVRYASMALAAAALLAGATQVWPQAGADTPAPPTQRGGAPMSKPITLADRPNAIGGEALYVEYCAMCHAPNGMGHGLLARRVDTPDLEKRDNLPAEYVVLAARQGIGNMPAIPRGEVSDEELQQIADYLAAGPHGGGQ
jgi:mono/diheme cytochrome c family protein